MFSNFLIERCYKHHELGGCGEVDYQKKILYASYVGKGVAQKHTCVYKGERASLGFVHTEQKMKFSIKNFFINCDQIPRKLQIWSHLLEKSLMENFIFCIILFIYFNFIKVFTNL